MCPYKLGLSAGLNDPTLVSAAKYAWDALFLQVFSADEYLLEISASTYFQVVTDCGI